ncbi:MAG TPA: TetR/AcrR family transcriptional regulator [Actinomycetes bacterium]
MTRPVSGAAAAPAPPRRRLRRSDWAAAALAAIREGGVAAVVVEGLAERLGATKGSFYWHFKDRDELVTAALERWERQETDDVIERLRAIADPGERLRRLFELAFGDHPGGDTNVALLADAANPLVSPALRRVTQRRLDFLTSAFAETGLTPPAARHHALLAYTAYVGYFELRRAAPSATPTGPDARAYLDHLLHVVAPPSAPLPRERDQAGR